MINKLAVSEEGADDMLALGRIVSYARQQADVMGLKFSTYCLDIALRSIVQELAIAGVCPAANENLVSAREQI
ncbi:hypothetical protein AAIH70_21450 [Neorhizobium sp. BT27B]|uniref:hypothetical protein n=1 Tax=Neorhizobium sp. BT27B TaxID=3142625 RepID=UPI003D2D6372